MLKNVSPGLIENVKDLKIALNKITVHDLSVYSMIEIYYKVAHKLNEVIDELSRFEGVLSDEVIKQNEKLIYLLGEGLENEVIKNIDRLIEQNFFEEIINEKIFSDLNNKIDSFISEVDSQFTHIDSQFTHIDSQLAYIENKTKVYFEDFGAKGDGVTDDTQAIQDCIIYCENNGLVADGRNKTYIISDIMGNNQNNTALCVRTDYGLYITKSLKIQNAKFKLKDGCPNFTSIINIYAIDGLVELYNLDLNGNRENQTPKSGREDGGMHGVRHQGDRTGVYADLIVQKCKMHHCSSDGMVLASGTPINQIVVRDSIFEFNRRNGVTDNALTNTVFDNCIFRNQIGGDDNIVGPFSGYHVEPDNYKDYNNKQLLNCQAYDNTGSGFKIDLPFGGLLTNIKLINCHTNGNGLHSYGMSFVVREETPGVDILIDGCTVDDVCTLSTKTVETKTGEININIKNSKISRFSPVSQIVEIDSVKIENSNLKYVLIQYSTLVNNLYISECEFWGNNPFAIQIDDSCTLKRVILNSCKFAGGFVTACVSIYNSSETIIKNCYFNCSATNIRLYNNNKAYIVNNIFAQKGNWNYFTLCKNIENLTYVYNILNNRNENGEIPSGGKNSRENVTYEVQNNTEVSYTQS